MPKNDKMDNNNDNGNEYINKLKKAKRNKKMKEMMPYATVAGAVLVAVTAGFFIISQAAAKPEGNEENFAVAEGLLDDLSEPTAEEPTMSAAELEAIRVEAEKQEVIESYNNLGIAQVTGYVNIRQSASTDSDILGKIYNGSACEVLSETESGWYQISSGGVEGYVSAEFIVTGEEAKAAAVELVELRAIITADTLNIREEASTTSTSVGRAAQNERYVVKSEQDGWIEINSGYISSEYAEVRYALNEARELDAREKVINLYENLGVSNVTSYLNMRDKPSEDGKIIGKMTSRSGGEILETVDGWHKIKSGPVTGYVKADYILTGNEARDAAIRQAVLMAIVSADGLNVRTEPSTESSIWTQISNSEKYLVVDQLDGWIEIELDDMTGYVAAEYVDVRYALAEAIKFTPLVVTPSTTGGGGGSSSGSSSSGSAGVTVAPSTEQGRRAEIVNYALQFLGNPYKWGGTSLTNGADCSGFTMSVYSKFGISLPHHSGSQAQRGRSVSSSEMRPADLIFYANGSGTINHVAMYIGNGQVIHASSATTGIKISTWNYRTPAKIVNVLGD